MVAALPRPPFPPIIIALAVIALAILSIHH
jgi:hypothetical protein